MHHGSTCEVGLYLLPTGGNPAAAWAGTASVYGWSPHSGSLSGPAPWCRSFAVHQNNAGSLDPPLALRPQSQNTTITLLDNTPPITSLKYGCTLLQPYFTCRLDILIFFGTLSGRTHWYWKGPAPSCRGTPPGWPSACRTSGTAASSSHSVHTCWTNAFVCCMEKQHESKKRNKRRVEEGCDPCLNTGTITQSSFIHKIRQ